MGKNLDMLRDALAYLHNRRYGTNVTRDHYQQMSEIRMLVAARIAFKGITWRKSQQDVTQKLKMYNIVFLRRYV